MDIPHQDLVVDSGCCGVVGAKVWSSRPCTGRDSDLIYGIRFFNKVSFHLNLLSLSNHSVGSS